jgi:hypothetical protein
MGNKCVGVSSRSPNTGATEDKKNSKYRIELAVDPGHKVIFPHLGLQLELERPRTAREAVCSWAFRVYVAEPFVSVGTTRAGCKPNRIVHLPVYVAGVWHNVSFRNTGSIVWVTTVEENWRVYVRVTVLPMHMLAQQVCSNARRLVCLK